MTALERVRKQHELVGRMVDAFRELTDEYWHDAMPGPWPSTRQLNIELGRMERYAARALRRVEQAALDHARRTVRTI
jgi:hypothetical protein